MRVEVGHHAPLEVARGELHRRLLGGVELQLRPLVDALAAPQHGQGLAVHGQALGERATSSASTGFCSTRARAFASSSRLRSTWRSASTTSTSRRSRARGSLAIGPSASSAFVFCSISSAALSRRAGRASIFSSPISPRQVRPLLVDLGDVRLLEAQPLLRLLELGQPEALQDVVVLGLRLAQLLLDLGAAAQPAGHLDVAQGLVGRLAAAQPPADDGEHEPDPRHDRRR